MPTVRRIRVKGLKNGFRVTLYAKEGTYALSVPKSRLGHLLLPVARAHPFEVRLKSAVSVDVPRGVKPVGKAARKAFTYRPRKRKETVENVEKPAATPKIEEVTSALASSLSAEPKRSRRKKAATAA